MEQQFLPSEQARPESRNAYDVTTYRVDDASVSVRTQTQQEEADRLMAVIQEEAQSRSKKSRKMRTIGISLLSLMIALAIIASLTTHHFQLHFLSNFGSFFAIIGGAAAASKRQKEATAELARLEALPLAAVGPFTDALGYGKKDMTAVASDKLVALLPRLQFSDAHLLNQEQRQILNRQCLSGKNTALTLAILKAYEQVGDAGAVPTVQRLAEGKRRAARDKQIQQAAAECLPQLMLCVERATAEQQLLRGASEPAATPETLLRAASGVSEADPSQLLRAEGSLSSEEIPGTRTGLPPREVG